MCVHQYSVHHLNTVQSHLLTPCFEVTQPQKASQMNYQMCISLLDPVKMMMTILDPAETSSDLTQIMSTCGFWFTSGRSLGEHQSRLRGEYSASSRESMDPKDISCILICAVSLIYIHTYITLHYIHTYIHIYIYTQLYSNVYIYMYTHHSWTIAHHNSDYFRELGCGTNAAGKLFPSMAMAQRCQPKSMVTQNDKPFLCPYPSDLSHSQIVSSFSEKYGVLYIYIYIMYI